MTTTSAVARDLGRARRACRSVACSQLRQRRRERGVADDAVQDADRGDADLHRRQELASGRRAAPSRACAPDSPASTITCSRALRLAVSAISDMANSALSRIRKTQKRNVHARGSRVSGSGGEAAQRSRIAAMHYLIGDLQGCCDALDRLLAEIGFSPSRDRLYVLGDLVNRGPAVARRAAPPARPRRRRARCLLGNHDLHLLAVAARRAAGAPQRHARRRSSTRPTATAWLDWLRQRPLALHAHGWLMVHAGVRAAVGRRRRRWRSPARSRRCCAAPRCGEFLRAMYGNEPARWNDALHGADRLRFIVNALTRLRFVHAPTARWSSTTKDGAAAAPPGFMPWFDVPGRGAPRARRSPSATGRRSACSSGPTCSALDTGCVWGGTLSAVRIDGGRRELVQVKCGQAAAFG